MKLLNDESKIYINAVSKKLRNKKEFAIIFMGDTHVGQENIKTSSTNQHNDDKCIDNYGKLLSLSTREQGNIMCIVHGGDAVHYGRKNLEKFVSTTKKILKYSSRHKSNKDKIPFFMNIGNHEYKISDDYHSKKTGLENYLQIIGEDNDIIIMKYQRLGVVLLNTGSGTNGKFENMDHFQEELNTLGEKIMEKAADDESYRFIIDMHIPPRIESIQASSKCKGTRTHSLNEKWNEQFTEFLEQYGEYILAVVSHHRHLCCQAKSKINGYQCRKNNKFIPVFITAQAGNCDCLRSEHREECGIIKINFEWNGIETRLKNVYKYKLMDKVHFNEGEVIYKIQ